MQFLNHLTKKFLICWPEMTLIERKNSHGGKSATTKVISMVYSLDYLWEKLELNCYCIYVVWCSVCLCSLLLCNKMRAWGEIRAKPLNCTNKWSQMLTKASELWKPVDDMKCTGNYFQKGLHIFFPLNKPYCLFCMIWMKGCMEQKMKSTDYSHWGWSDLTDYIIIPWYELIVFLWNWFHW